MSRLYNLWELIKMDYVINIKNEEILMNLKIQKNIGTYKKIKTEW